MAKSHLHIFTAKELRDITRDYNLHVKISGYSTMNKTKLIGELEKHIHITDSGRIVLKPHNDLLVSKSAMKKLSKGTEGEKSRHPPPKKIKIKGMKPKETAFSRMLKEVEEEEKAEKAPKKSTKKITMADLLEDNRPTTLNELKKKHKEPEPEPEEEEYDEIKELEENMKKLPASKSEAEEITRKATVAKARLLKQEEDREKEEIQDPNYLKLKKISKASYSDFNMARVYFNKLSDKLKRIATPMYLDIANKKARTILGEMKSVYSDRTLQYKAIFKQNKNILAKLIKELEEMGRLKTLDDIDDMVDINKDFGNFKGKYTIEKGTDNPEEE